MGKKKSKRVSAEARVLKALKYDTGYTVEELAKKTSLPVAKVKEQISRFSRLKVPMVIREDCEIKGEKMTVWYARPFMAAV